MAPGSRNIIILLAGVLASREKHAQALKVLESLDEEDVDGLVARSQVLLKLGRIEDALAAARSAVGKAPGNAEGHASLGFVFLRAGDSVQAVREFDLALRMCPERAEFKAGRACALSLAGRHADALEVFRQLDRELPTIFAADPELRPYYERSVSGTAQCDP